MFYSFNDKRSLSTLFAVADENLWPRLYYVARGYTDLVQSPVCYVKDKCGGNKIADILSATPMEPIVVRTWVRDLMLESGITGWIDFPVRVVDFDGKDIADYCGLGITGRCGGLDASKLWTCRRADGFMQYYGLDIDTSVWDGSDLFMLPSSGFIFATHKVKTLFSKNKVSNIHFKYLDEIYFYHMDEVSSLLTGNMTEDIPPLDL